MAELPVRIGEVVAEKYRVERLLGEGGMGVVVAARHLELDGLVALKFLLPEELKHPDSVLRFQREARAAARLRSEHVGRVLDFGKLSSGVPYLVMEYLEGNDLAALLRQVERLSIEEAAEYVLHACEALAEAHAFGIVHRDIKPSNLFLTRKPNGVPCIKVLDFGISKVPMSDRDGAASTTTSAVLGSPLYMSPEQMRSARSVDGRSDIWALGVVLHELLAGTPPFNASGLPELCVAILEGSPIPLRTARPDLPLELEEIVRRCLQKDPSHRYRNVFDLASALAPYAPPRSRPSPELLDDAPTKLYAASLPPAVSVPPTGAGQGPGVQTASTWTRTKARGAKTKTAGLFAAAGLAVVASTLAIIAVRRSPSVSGAPSAVTSTAPPTSASVVSISAPSQTLLTPAALPDQGPTASPAPQPSRAAKPRTPEPPPTSKPVSAPLKPPPQDDREVLRK